MAGVKCGLRSSHLLRGYDKSARELVLYNLFVHISPQALSFVTSTIVNQRLASVPTCYGHLGSGQHLRVCTSAAVGLRVLELDDTRQKLFLQDRRHVSRLMTLVSLLKLRVRALFRHDFLDC